ncbi:MAG: hypothetical protein CVV49_21000 [Spirochaetae bacterium HGW-Spirochaetae-5]|nr:MAG: hypothetical protein CVV49_21000 [Spirochaetae bacterium HGW-Spirochaetae-5]
MAFTIYGENFMKKARYIFLAVGVILLVVLFAVFGIKKPVMQIVEFGWKFWICVLIYLFNQMLLTYGWFVLITYPLKARQYFDVLMARIAGDAATTINTAASIAGDALKAMYLKEVVPFKIGFASVVMDRTIHMVGNTLLILTGLFVGFFKLNMPIYVLAGVFAFFLFFLGFLIYIMKKQKHGIIQHAISMLPSRENLNHFWISLFMHTVPVMAAGTIEIYIIMYYAGGSATPLDAMFVYLFGLFIAAVAFFVPLNIGTSEGSYSMVLAFLGYDPVLGLTVGILRRLRALVWSGLGLILLFHKGLTGKDVERDESLLK